MWNCLRSLGVQEQWTRKERVAFYNLLRTDIITDCPSNIDNWNELLEIALSELLCSFSFTAA
jgi:hypothetical protein